MKRAKGRGKKTGLNDFPPICRDWWFEKQDGIEWFLSGLHGKNHLVHFPYSLFQMHVQKGFIMLWHYTWNGAFWIKMQKYGQSNYFTVFGLKKVRERSGGRIYVLASFLKRTEWKKSKDITRYTPYLIQNNQNLFQYISKIFYWFILS